MTAKQLKSSDFLIICSEFNSIVTEKLLASCVSKFGEYSLNPKIVKVPGALEIPLIAQKLISSRRPKVVLALGCVIRGETSHYDAVCSYVTDGILQVSLKSSTPIIFEVLMVDNLAKGMERTFKGSVAAETAISMLKILSSCLKN